jgi:hypothetical protein
MKTRIIIIDIITFICLPVWAEDTLKTIMLSGGNISTTQLSSPISHQGCNLSKYSQEKFCNYSYVMKRLYSSKKEEFNISSTYQLAEWISADLKFFKNEKSAAVGFEFKVNDNLKIRPNFKMTISENTNFLNNFHAYLNCIYSF